MTSTERGLWCVVPAAGRGARFGGEVPKQYLTLAGKPMLLQTLERLAAHPRVAGVMVALAADDHYWRDRIAIGAMKILTTIGGERRADSVLAGLDALRERVGDDEFVLVHDAARPCIGLDDISRLIELGTMAGGALLAAPLRDTLKRADDEQRVEATEPRDARWRALTPQMFRYGELAAALRAAAGTGITITDEAMAMERAGHRPLLVEGSEGNIKITTPDDLALAEFLIARHAKRGF
ncbi:MAG TPA: 2-C-methyl-D-erythritol 4-phosphate cytidylyltransferase [Rudaea sp.]|nr:2-C-methyl-D-erythritol 4-phosphate cytidylyltransferase [Rudaea sp.]